MLASAVPIPRTVRVVRAVTVDSLRNLRFTAPLSLWPSVMYSIVLHTKEARPSLGGAGPYRCGPLAVLQGFERLTGLPFSAPCGPHDLSPAREAVGVLQDHGQVVLRSREDHPGVLQPLLERLGVLLEDLGDLLERAGGLLEVLGVSLETLGEGREDEGEADAVAQLHAHEGPQGDSQPKVGGRLPSDEPVGDGRTDQTHHEGDTGPDIAVEQADEQAHKGQDIDAEGGELGVLAVLPVVADEGVDVLVGDVQARAYEKHQGDQGNRQGGTLDDHPAQATSVRLLVV